MEHPKIKFPVGSYFVSDHCSSEEKSSMYRRHRAKGSCALPVKRCSMKNTYIYCLTGELFYLTGVLLLGNCQSPAVASAEPERTYLPSELTATHSTSMLCSRRTPIC